jgi:hypothetical protein
VAEKGSSMTEWNFDLSQAPRDGTHVILAMPNKTTLRSYWCTPKADHAHWCMLSHKNEPVAWMPWPEHPFANSPQEQGTDGGAIVEVKVTDRLANANGVEPSPSEQSSAPILHKHMFLDDVGGGA